MSFGSGHLGDSQMLSFKQSPDVFNSIFLEGGETAAFFVLPAPFYASSQAGQPVVVLRLEGADLCLSCGDDGECGSLYAAAGKLGVVFACQRAGGIDSHQPIRLGAAFRGVVQVVVFAPVL